VLDSSKGTDVTRGLRDHLLQSSQDKCHKLCAPLWEGRQNSQKRRAKFCEVVYLEHQRCHRGIISDEPFKNRRLCCAWRLREDPPVTVLAEWVIASLRILIPRVSLPDMKIRKQSGRGHVGGAVTQTSGDADTEWQGWTPWPNWSAYFTESRHKAEQGRETLTHSLQASLGLSGK